MDNKKNKKGTTKEVLTQAEKSVEQEAPALIVSEAPSKAKRKRNHKKKSTIIDTPIADVAIAVELDELPMIQPKLNWFERQWNKFVLWYNA